MANNYCRLNHVRNELNAEGTTAQDTDILRAIERASEFARSFTGRIFHTETGTCLFNGNGKTRLRLASHALEPWRGDLVSVTTLKVDDNYDGVYELTLVEDTDYWLSPDNPTTHKRPATHIEIVTGRNTTSQLSWWPKRRRSIEIVGTWGFPPVWEAVVVSGSAVTGTLSDTGADLTITASVSVADVVFPGDTLLIDSEQLEVTAVSTTTITVVRAINGTTGAAHSSKALSVRRFPADLERAVSKDAARYLWNASQGYPEVAPAGEWARIRDALGAYKMPAVA